MRKREWRERALEAEAESDERKGALDFYLDQTAALKASLDEALSKAETATALRRLAEAEVARLQAAGPLLTCRCGFAWVKHRCMSFGGKQRCTNCGQDQ